VLNAMPAQFGRLLIARAHGGDRAPPCIVVRDQAWDGATSIVAVETGVVATIAAALHCTVDEARAVMQRVELPLWVLVTTRPLPDRKTLLDLELRLPAVRWLFLAGDQPDLAEAARTIGAALLPPIEPGADLRWLQGYKRLMEWARPRKRSTVAPGRKPTKAAPRRPLRK
jgi:hypothetical protein